ncbi:toll/interleukin-1 receptor domain-containing protein [Prosthecobacter vanneervenii]|uniref:Tetratricopeptide (TPR) repeat protein n=1 Tax=Prosthecobacter vanneervenii TaxID=48466 RepID=A0A7W7Y8K5_9BACT|nr:toll/interleukin-1 receptor domain-containing protein [Prosthecobacter vanneervenii]MBB5031480.1 tetratricopeptide (TPR) repeat protein [Prosthecobacter vanneervenii]
MAKSPAPSSKRLVRYFVSYTRTDGDLPEKLLKELDKLFGACAEFEFKRWQDTHILPGEKWHAEIQGAIEECDFGLLLVSPAFLGNAYISEHELPHFVNGKKLCLPVGLCRISLENHDLKGLQETQIYLHVPARGKHGKAFDQFGSAKTQAEFAYTLHERIIARLKKSLGEKTPAPALAQPATKPAESTRDNLPRLMHFYGRQKELEVIAKALLPQTRTWGVLIDGPGGMGKTSLAVRAAELARPQFDRVLFVSTKTQKLTPQGAVALSQSIVPAYPELLSETARLLGLAHAKELPEAERAAVIKAALEKEKVLLLFDNLENLDKAQMNLLYEFVADLPPSCKAIVTSRRRTDVEARLIRLEKLEQDAALELLEELAADRELLRKASTEQRVGLYVETGGNPLLMRWVVGQLGRGSCRSIAAALELCRKAGDSNDPLEFIFGDLLETFSPAETQVLVALSYFTQKIEVKHIAEVAKLSQTAAQTALGDLANRALVMPDEREETFALVPMVADFLRARRPKVVAETGSRLEKRALALILENGYSNHDCFPKLDAAWPVVAPALRLFLAGDNKRLQEVCGALASFLDFTGRWDEWLALSQQAEGWAVAAGDHRHAGWRAYQAGWVHYLRWQAEAVLASAGRAAQHWQRAFPAGGTAQAGLRERTMALRLRGIGHQLQKDYPAATAAFREVVYLRRQLGAESTDLAMALNSLAFAERLSGDHAAAERDYHEALRVAQAVSDDEGIAIFTGNLAVLALDREDWPQAEALALEALALAEKLGRQELIAADCHRLALALARQGHGAEGLPHARRAVEIYTRLGSPNLADAKKTLAECEGEG